MREAAPSLNSGFRPEGDIICPPKMFERIHLRPLDDRVNLFAD